VSKQNKIIHQLLKHQSKAQQAQAHALYNRVKGKVCVRKFEGLTKADRYGVLTHNSELNGITGSLSLCVCGHARVIACVVPRHSLQDETVVADDHTRAHVLHHLTILKQRLCGGFHRQSNKERNICG